MAIKPEKNCKYYPKCLNNIIAYCNSRNGAYWLVYCGSRPINWSWFYEATERAQNNYFRLVLQMALFLSSNEICFRTKHLYNKHAHLMSVFHLHTSIHIETWKLIECKNTLIWFQELSWNFGSRFEPFNEQVLLHRNH